MVKIEVEVSREEMEWLHALAVVRSCEPSDLLSQAMRRLKITQTERERVMFYRHVQATGSPLTDLHH